MHVGPRAFPSARQGGGSVRRRLVWHMLDQGHLWLRSERRGLQAALSWQRARPPRTHALTLTLFPEAACLRPLALHYTGMPAPSCPLGPPRALHRCTSRGHPSRYKHLCHVEAGWEGTCQPHRQFQGLPHLSPITLLPGGRLQLQVREQLPPNFSSGKLLAAQPASPKPLVSVASQAPRWHGARQLCRAGEP